MLHGIGGGLILAVVNFLMVFLVLGGLASVLIGLKRLIAFWENRQAQTPLPANAGRIAPPETPHAQSDKKHLAVITAALHAFTGQPVGALRIDSIEPLAQAPVSQNQTLAVITAALHQYLETPPGALTITSATPLRSGPYAVTTPESSFRIVRPQAVGAINPWTIAGRLDAMGFEHR